jgi:hypothetical protein
MKVTDEKRRIRSLLVRGTDPRIRTRTKMSQIRNTAFALLYSLIIIKHTKQLVNQHKYRLVQVSIFKAYSTTKQETCTQYRTFISGLSEAQTATKYLKLRRPSYRQCCGSGLFLEAGSGSALE